MGGDVDARHALSTPPPTTAAQLRTLIGLVESLRLDILDLQTQHTHLIAAVQDSINARRNHSSVGAR